MVKIETVVVGPIETNCYLVSSDTHLFIIDPGFDAPAILDALGTRSVDAVILTHRHFDHISALADVVKATGAPVFAGALDVDAIENPADHLTPSAAVYAPDIEGAEVDRSLEDGDVVEAGDMRFEVLHTPGHTVGGICLFDEAAEILISGDTMFYGTNGRTDLPTGNREQMKDSMRRLLALPPDTTVYPGHGPTTTIARERTGSDFLPEL